jgi:hypothetical protein
MRAVWEHEVRAVGHSPAPSAPIKTLTHGFKIRVRGLVSHSPQRPNMSQTLFITLTLLLGLMVCAFAAEEKPLIIPVGEALCDLIKADPDSRYWLAYNKDIYWSCVAAFKFN